MAEKKSADSGNLKTGTAVIFACVTFILGFLVGVVFTVYKSESPVPRTGQRQGVQSQNVDNSEKGAMRASLEAEVAENPENATAWKQLGHIYFDNDQYQKAIHAYEKALALEPGNADVLTDLGVMYRRAGSPKKAIEVFNQAIAAEPKHEIARFNKGIVLLHDLEDRQGALAAWESLLELNPLAMAPNGQSVDELVEHYKKHME